MGLAGGLATNGGYAIGENPTVVSGVPASGVTSGVTDLAAFNAALVTGAYVRGVPGSTYYINGPLTLRTGCTLDMTDCTINQVGAGVNMIQNAAMTPTHTATDGASITSGAATFVSPTIAPLVTTGDTIQVALAGYGGSAWYGTVSSVNLGANTVTMNVNAQVTIASGATIYHYPTTARDTDIAIIGGTWNALDPGNNAHTAGATPQNDFATCLRRIDRLTVRDMVWTQTGATAQGGRFVLSIADATSVQVDRIRFNGTAGDGVHLSGPITSASVTNIYGTTGDDFVVCNTTDSNGPNVTDTQGNITDITFERIFPSNALSAGKHYTFDTSGLFTSQGITFRSVKGTTSLNPLTIIGTANGLLLEDINVRPPSGKPAISVSVPGGGFNSDITIRHVVWNSANTASVGVVQLTQPPQTVTIEDIKFMSSPAGTNIGVQIGSSSTGTRVISVSKIRMTNTNPTTFYAVQCTGGTLRSLRISDIYFSSSSGQILNITGTPTLVMVHISEIDANGIATGVVIPASVASFTLRFTNGLFKGTNLVSTQSPVAVECVDLDFNTTGAIFNMVGTGATPVTVKMAQFSQAGAGALFAKDGTQSVTMTGVPSLQSGTATLTAGASASQPAALITANGQIRLTNVALGGTAGALYNTITAGTGFVIHSTSGTDTSTIFWEIVQY